MDFLRANYVLETAIDCLSAGDLSDASRELTDFVEANRGRYEAAPEKRKEPTTLPSMKAAGHVGTEPQRNKGRLVGVPQGWHAAGFVDPHDPEVQARRKADSDYFHKHSSPPAGSGPSKKIKSESKSKTKKSGVWSYKSLVKKESVDAMKAALAFLEKKS